MSRLKFGYYVPNFDLFGDVRLLADLAKTAEETGWDGFFLWDHLLFREPVVDPWIAFSAMALCTRRITFGPLVTPLPRRHVAKLAREIITLDQLSGGRMTFGAGAGFAYLPDFTAFGDEADPKARAAQLEEGLSILSELLVGNPLSQEGHYYRVNCEPFQTGPQQPRVPIWIGATWPARKPLRRAAQWDGVVPCGKTGLEIEPGEFGEVVSFISELRGTPDGFDFIKFGNTREPTDSMLVEASVNAGATWWIENAYPGKTTPEDVRERLEKGPPVL